jgi:phage-related protein
MYLKNDRIVVTINGLTFRSYRSGTGSQLVLDPTALTGWDDGANIKRSATVRPVSSGDFVEPYNFSSRLIALTGTAIAKDRGGLQVLRDKLTGVLEEDEYAEICVETSASTRYATVGLENKVEWIQQIDNAAMFRIEFYAPDPYIYSAERIINLGSTKDAGGGLSYPLQYPLDYSSDIANTAVPTVNNAGNAASWPKFKITGNYFSGFVLSNGRDKKITYNGQVSMNSPVVIDTAKGTAMQGGVDKSVYLSTRQWFSIDPGQTIRPTFTPIQDASGWCDIIIRDTFI